MSVVLLEAGLFLYQRSTHRAVLGGRWQISRKRNGSFSTPVTEGERSILTGTVPASTMGEYQRELAAYSRGQGQLSLSLKGYQPGHNTEEVGSNWL